MYVHINDYIKKLLNIAKVEKLRWIVRNECFLNE